MEYRPVRRPSFPRCFQREYRLFQVIGKKAASAGSLHCLMVTSLGVKLLIFNHLD